MIINGNNFNNNQNNGFLNNTFKRNNSMENTNTNINSKNNTFGFNEDLSTYKHTNPTNDIDMYDKSIAMLQERYKNNLISLDEFNKKCEQLGKKKKASLERQNKF